MNPERRDLEFSLRPAKKSDAPGLLELVVALALFEKLPPPSPQAQARLIQHGFGKPRRFESWLAFVSGRAKPVGYAIFFETYSSFLAQPTLYIEDLFVLPELRGHGIGKALLNQCVRLAVERECGRMEWTCLNWNRRAQCVYETMGARRLSEWILYRLDRAGMERVLDGDEGLKN